RGRPTSFSRPRRLTLVVRDADGHPVPGVEAALWTNRFDRMIEWTPARATGDDGRAAFDSLPPWSFDVHAFLSPTDDWGMEMGEVGLEAGGAAKEVVVG